MMSWLLATALVAASNAPAWELMPADSALTFTAEYDNVGFEGRFERFEVNLAFDPADPAAASLVVIVDVSSVNTENSERDEALAEAEWFDFAHHDRARYHCLGITAGGPRDFHVEGELTLKGITRPLGLDFDWTVEDGGVRLQGTARMQGDTVIDRMEFEIGTGDWADPELIGHEVEVQFDLRLQPAAEDQPASEPVEEAAGALPMTRP